MSALNSPIFQTRKLRLRFNNLPVVDTQDRSERLSGPGRSCVGPVFAASLPPTSLPQLLYSF